jgi:hypothetical protein
MKTNLGPIQERQDGENIDEAVDRRTPYFIGICG